MRVSKSPYPFCRADADVTVELALPPQTQQQQRGEVDLGSMRVEEEVARPEDVWAGMEDKARGGLEQGLAGIVGAMLTEALAGGGVKWTGGNAVEVVSAEHVSGGGNGGGVRITVRLRGPSRDFAVLVVSLPAPNGQVVTARSYPFCVRTLPAPMRVDEVATATNPGTPHDEIPLMGVHEYPPHGLAWTKDSGGKRHRVSAAFDVAPERHFLIQDGEVKDDAVEADEFHADEDHRDRVAFRLQRLGKFRYVGLARQRMPFVSMEFKVITKDPSRRPKASEDVSKRLERKRIPSSEAGVRKDMDKCQLRIKQLEGKIEAEHAIMRVLEERLAEITKRGAPAAATRRGAVARARGESDSESGSSSGEGSGGEDGEEDAEEDAGEEEEGGRARRGGGRGKRRSDVGKAAAAAAAASSSSSSSSRRASTSTSTSTSAKRGRRSGVDGGELTTLATLAESRFAMPPPPPPPSTLPRGMSLSSSLAHNFGLNQLAAAATTGSSSMLDLIPPPPPFGGSLSLSMLMVPPPAPSGSPPPSSSSGSAGANPGDGSLGFTAAT